ncbi:MAG: PQQ-dependent sugar dehydrogenase [Acidobacteria bacterium]|nr:PQQ-dependent sugar dehydrogenase [Acidobacteriota bacterium]
MKRVKVGVVFLIVIASMAAVVFAQGVPAPFTIRLQPFLSGLAQPVLLRTAKDGTKRLFVVQQRGIIRVVQPGSNVATDFMNIAAKVSSTGSERGLLGLAFHPQFASNSYFFVNYTRASDGATIVARYTATNNNTLGDPNSEVILLNIPQPFSNHNGGMIEFGPDGNLYIGMGDGGSANDPGARAQNINELLGKFLRITPSTAAVPPVPAYTNPPDNPYVGINGADEIYAIGVRNPWRWSFDRGGTNQLWAGDVGQDAIEEVDIINRGGNYGWRVYEGTQCTNNDPGLCTPGNFTMPVFQYSQTATRCSVTGGYVYRGGLRTFTDGTYLNADYCTGEIFTWNGAQHVMQLDTPRLVASFGEDDDGELYAVGIGSTTNATGTVEKIVRAKASADFDGDFKTDISIFRPSTGVWYIINSSNSSLRIQQFGLNGDIPTPEDWDGDNITDIGVFRPSNGVWYHFRSSNNTVGITQFGLNGDTPAQGDFDGDGRADLAVFRPSTGVWYVQRSSNASVDVQQFGINGDVPVAGDYDGDGKYDRAVFRPNNGVWYRLGSSTGAFAQLNFGSLGDVPSVGDFDGDGKLDNAVFRPSTGVWYRLRSSDGGVLINQFGVNNDVPAVGDYDGDGLDDIAVFRPSTGVWYTQATSNGAVGIQQFGLSGDAPAPTYDAP